MTEAVVAQTQPSSNRQNGRSKAVFIYIGLFLLAYFVFFIATFPYDLLAKGYVQARIPAKWQPVRFDDIKLKLPFGFKARDLTAGEDKTGAPLLEADYLEVSAGLFSAVRGKIDVSWKGDLYGGKISGNYDGVPEKGNVYLRVAGIELNRLKFLKDLIKFDISGKLAGEMDILWSPRWVENDGNLSLNINEGTAKNVNLTIMTVDFTFTKVEGDLTVSNGVLSINRLVLEGSPAGFEIDGTITVIPEDVSESMLDLNLLFLPTPEFESDASLAFSLLQKVDEGRYKAHLGGTFKRPSFPK